MALVYRHIRLDTNDVFYIGIELDSKNKISASAKGFSKSARKNAFEKLSKKVIDIELNIIYNSIREASLNSNFSETTIRRFLNNKYPNKTNLKYLKDYEFTRI